MVKEGTAISTKIKAGATVQTDSNNWPSNKIKLENLFLPRPTIK